MSTTTKLWGGRFTGAIDPLMFEFNQCLSVDKKMFAVDIRGSKAYALALSQTSPPILTKLELDAIVSGLSAVQLEWETHAFVIKPDDEDIHTANERRLSELIGNEIGGKLHTGRSRNDQVATDMRLWLLEEIDQEIGWLKGVIGTLVGRAEEWIDHLAAGFTHLQVCRTPLVALVDIPAVAKADKPAVGYSLASATDSILPFPPSSRALVCWGSRPTEESQTVRGPLSVRFGPMLLD